MYSDELYHHGIKGQRWGIRRFQKKDGTLTNAGKKRYSDTKEKSKHRTVLEEKYKKRGMTKADAEKEAEKRIKIEKVLVATAGLTIAAAGVYAGNKFIKARTDSLIKAGHTLQRVEMQDTQGKLHDMFYAARDRSDKTKYAGLLGMTRKQQTGKAYMMKIDAKKDIKIASDKKARQVFEELYKNDPDFNKSVRSSVSEHFSGRNKVDPDDMSSRAMKKMYDNFNSALIDIRGKGSGADKKFYDKLKSQGYGGIRDMNDMKFSGYKAKNPLIVFGQNDNLMVKSVKEMSNGEIGKNLAKSGAEETVRMMGKYAVAGLPVSALYMYAQDYRDDPEQFE